MSHAHPEPPYGGRPDRGAPTPPFGVPEARPVARRPLRATDTAGRRWVTPAPTRLHRRLVGVARVLAGGLVVLTLAVIAGPWVLDGPGAGGAVVVGHLVGAVVAVAATAVAAHPRVPPAVGLVAALAVPVDVLVVLGSYWWA